MCVITILKNLRLLYQNWKLLGRFIHSMKQEDFNRVLLPVARQTPNFEYQWVQHFNSRHQVSATPKTTPAHPSSGRWNYGREMAENFSERGNFNVTFGFFYMPYIYDMEQVALLPFWRKVSWGFFRLKNPMASARFEPVNLGNRGQHAYL